jgi:hypothetical protein
MTKESSKKYMVLADIDGKIRVLSMRSNASQRRIEALCRKMVRKLFATQTVKNLRVRPWPAEELSLPSSLEPSMS